MTPRTSMHWNSLLLGIAFVTALAEAPTAYSARPTLESEVRVAALHDREPLLDIDSLFYIENQGLTRVLVTLNEHHFKLVTDPAEVAHGDNAFLIPLNGAITFEIGALLEPDDENPFDDDCNAPIPNGNNCIGLVSQGPDGAEADVVISDVLLVGEKVAFAITPADLAPLPQALELLQSYPNPFVDVATITYTIPEDRTTGLPVSLILYDTRGRHVRTLVNVRQFPGTFSVVWDGTDGSGRPVAAGLYFGRLGAGEMRKTIRLLRLR